MDALRVHIHGGYLLAQVALEAFCRSQLPEGKNASLVTNKKAWSRFLRSKRVSLRQHCPDDASAEILYANLANAIRPPAGKSVPAAFEQWSISLPEVLLKELKKRGESAHRFTMFDEIGGDVQEASDRVEMIQTMLAAAIARAVGYTGQIAGWERDETGHQLPAEFWPGDATSETKVMYECALPDVGDGLVQQ